MKIRIDHLQIRLRGIAPSTAHETATQLGSELAQQLAALRVARTGANAHIARLDVGTMQAKGGADAATLRQIIAANVTRSLKPKT